MTDKPFKSIKIILAVPNLSSCAQHPHLPPFLCCLRNYCVCKQDSPMTIIITIIIIIGRDILIDMDIPSTMGKQKYKSAKSTETPPPSGVPHGYVVLPHTHMCVFLPLNAITGTPLSELVPRPQHSNSHNGEICFDEYSLAAAEHVPPRRLCPRWPCSWPRPHPRGPPLVAPPWPLHPLQKYIKT